MAKNVFGVMFILRHYLKGYREYNKSGQNIL